MSGDTTIWLDGVKGGALPLPDRGLDFGDGLFETILLRHGRPQFLEVHLRRLATGLSVLGFPDCLESASKLVLQAADSVSSERWVALRLTVTRGAAERGYAPPSDVRPRIIAQLTTLDRDCSAQPPPASLGFPEQRLSAQPALAGIKHLNRLDQVLAARQMRDQGYSEGVMLDQAGQVISVIAGNLFVVKGGTLITPPVTDSGIRGTRRSLLMERWAPRAGLDVREGHVSLEEIMSAEEMFYTNALYGIRPVAAVGEVRWTLHPVVESLFSIYREEMH